MSDAETCPLCDGPNACGVAAGHSTCWCFDHRIDPDVLARVPETSRESRCVCQRCATTPAPAATAPPRA
jgi:hypothetical protein